MGLQKRLSVCEVLFLHSKDTEDFPKASAPPLMRRWFTVYRTIGD